MHRLLYQIDTHTPAPALCASAASAINYGFHFEIVCPCVRVCCCHLQYATPCVVFRPTARPPDKTDINITITSGVVSTCAQFISRYRPGTRTHHRRLCHRTITHRTMGCGWHDDTNKPTRSDRTRCASFGACSIEREIGKRYVVGLEGMLVPGRPVSIVPGRSK